MTFSNPRNVAGVSPRDVMWQLTWKRKLASANHQYDFYFKVWEEETLSYSAINVWTNVFNDTVKLQHRHIFDNVRLTVPGNNVCSDGTHSGSRGL